MERFDAIVVGAGPAGSTSACLLARAGARVLLLDRARFPRDKPCGGGLTYRAVRQLPFPVDPVVEDVVERFELGLGYRRRFERRCQGPLVLMTQRRRLDAFMADRAAEAGADFRDGVKASDVSVDESGATVRMNGDRAAAAVLIGADGVNGVTARSFDLAGPRRHGVALEGNAPYDETSHRRFRGRAVVELGAVPGGYAWVFPKGDHVNVGVGGWEWEGPRLRAHLSRACEAYGVPETRLTDIRGYRLPMRGAGGHPGRGRALLVGDAAGLVDPLTGDGIYEALVSARLASQTVLDFLTGRTADLDTYAKSLSDALDSLASTSWRAKVAFDRFPRLSYAIARTPMAWRLAEEIIRGDVTRPSAASGRAQAPLRVLKALGRVAADPRPAEPPPAGV